MPGVIRKVRDEGKVQIHVTVPVTNGWKSLIALAAGARQEMFISTTLGGGAGGGPGARLERVIVYTIGSYFPQSAGSTPHVRLASRDQVCALLACGWLLLAELSMVVGPIRGFGTQSNPNRDVLATIGDTELTSQQIHRSISIQMREGKLSNDW